MLLRSVVVEQLMNSAAQSMCTAQTSCVHLYLAQTTRTTLKYAMNELSSQN